MKLIKSIKKLKICKSLKKGNSLKERYPQYEIGRGTYGIQEIQNWGEGAEFKIGAFCSVASGVKIFLGGEHRTDWVTTFPFNILWKSTLDISGHPKTKGDVIIGNDVWIGTDAIILSGVVIGDGAVVGARSVVTKNIEPYTIYAGNPARKIGRRFEDRIIQELLDLKWWDFRDRDIEKLLPLMLNDDIQLFIRKARMLKEKSIKMN